jgi:uncharacterized protein YaiE (UPF0345 family)
MKTKLKFLTLALITSSFAFAQEYKLAKNTGKLVIQEVDQVSIEGYSGNEIIFSSLDGSRGKDKRAEGLKAVSAMGLEDNTSIGLSVVDKGNTIEVNQLKRMDGPNVKIMVPKGVSISYQHTSPHGNSLTIKNVESEIEVSTVHNGVRLENVTGPMTIKTVHGDIDADFSSAIKSPISMVSAHGPIDVTVPATAKLTLSMSTSYGEVFVDPAIKIEFENKGEWKVYGSNKISGKVNGGGQDLTLSSAHNNIYLRKK